MSDGEFRCVIFTNNYPSTVAFYRDGLELPIVDGWDRGPDDKGVLFGAASGIIEVVAGPHRESASFRGGMILFEVEDVDVRYLMARRKELPVHQELRNQSWGHRDFKLTDPNGIVVGLFSKIPS